MLGEPTPGRHSDSDDAPLPPTTTRWTTPEPVDPGASDALLPPYDPRAEALLEAARPEPEDTDATGPDPVSADADSAVEPRHDEPATTEPWAAPDTAEPSAIEDVEDPWTDGGEPWDVAEPEIAAATETDDEPWAFDGDTGGTAADAVEAEGDAGAPWEESDRAAADSAEPRAAAWDDEAEPWARDSDRDEDEPWAAEPEPWTPDDQAAPTAAAPDDEPWAAADTVDDDEPWADTPDAETADEPSGVSPWDAFGRAVEASASWSQATTDGAPAYPSGAWAYGDEKPDDARTAEAWERAAAGPPGGAGPAPEESAVPTPEEARSGGASLATGGAGPAMFDELAGRLEEFARRLRADGYQALGQAMGGADRLDAAFASFIAGYIAARGD